ncbi:MAG TPA: hypothetical protein VKK81_27980 [Candidatus Binatia bacterium]|nr:hypothetical protein [Candidatus Binatia bacterium]
MKKLLLITTAVLLTAISASAQSAWKYEEDSRQQPSVTYYDKNNRQVFYVGCGRAFVVGAVYPAKPGKQGDKATIILSNSKTSMKIVGEFTEPNEDDPTTFVQWDLGYSRQDPKLFGKIWEREKTKLFEFLNSEPITVSAEGHSYQIPAAVTKPDWKRKVC